MRSAGFEAEPRMLAPVVTEAAGPLFCANCRERASLNTLLHRRPAFSHSDRFSGSF